MGGLADYIRQNKLQVTQTLTAHYFKTNVKTGIFEPPPSERYTLLI